MAKGTRDVSKRGNPRWPSLRRLTTVKPPLSGVRYDWAPSDVASSVRMEQAMKCRYLLVCAAGFVMCVLGCILIASMRIDPPNSMLRGPSGLFTICVSLIDGPAIISRSMSMIRPASLSSLAGHRQGAQRVFQVVHEGHRQLEVNGN